jgi:hydroxyacylglutathione hydrolase
MFFKPYYLGCLAHASYLIAGNNGEAAVIDPRRDVDEYIADATANGLTIKYVIETHLHADFVSGHIELAQRTDAKIVLGGATPVNFASITASDGDEIKMGDVRLRFLETPGHTPEGISIVAYTNSEPDPKMVFTGDTLFIGDVGRPDLAGWRGHGPEEMAHAMYRSLKDKLLALPDATEIWPAHGAGSACGRSLSDERVSTIGREKLFDPALKPILNGDEEGFVKALIAGQSSIPAYFPHDVTQNRQGAATMADVRARGRAMSAQEVEELSESGTVVLDTRSPDVFCAGHIPGAINIGLNGKFASWVGSILKPDMPLIVVEDDGLEEGTVTRLARVGFENVVGWLDGNMETWRKAGGEVVEVPQVSTSELASQLSANLPIQVLDVRTVSEFEAGHIDTAIHIPVDQLESHLSALPNSSLSVICGSGYRSAIACSLLQRSGRSDVTNVVGGWAAWQEAMKAVL